MKFNGGNAFYGGIGFFHKNAHFGLFSVGETIFSKN